MRNTKINNIRNTMSTPFIDFKDSYQVKTSELQTFTPKGVNKNQVFESNCNYFLRRMEPEKNTSVHNSVKGGHQRYASMGSSRVYDKNNEVPFEKVLNCESNSYLFNYKQKQARILDTRCQVTPVCEPQSYIGSPTKNLMKLSMKSIHKNGMGSNERSSILKQSQSSTIGQTNTMSGASKIVQERMVKEQLIKYFVGKLKVLSDEIGVQGSLILGLEQRIKDMNVKLLQRQRMINELTKGRIEQRVEGNYGLSKVNNSINELKNELENLMKNKMVEQAQNQNRINIKIERMMEVLTKGKELRNQEILVFGKSLKKFNQVLEKTVASLNITQSLSRISCNLSRTMGEISSALTKPIFNSILEQTAQFSQIPQNSLNDSQSYFFHASELSNLQKITQLFISRNGKAIKCFIDKNNYVKYRDTGTFMFHKNGDFVQLNNKQKMYYVDRGFIVE